MATKNYLTTETIEKSLMKIDKVEQRLDDFVKQSEQTHMQLYHELSVFLEEVREEVMRMRNEMIAEREDRRKRQAEALKSLKSV